MDPDKKQRIMQAAERLFRMRRVHEITLDEIAREADVGKGTLYLYFTDKEDLIFQAAVAGFDRMCQLFRIILAEGDRDMEGGGIGLRQRWRQRRKSMTEAVAAILAQGMESGEVRPDMPAEVLAEYLLGILRTRSWELQDRPEEERSLAGVADIFMNGAAPAAGKPKTI